MRLPAEILQLSRFGLVGILATIVHMVIVMSLDAQAQMDTLIVHVSGYLGAFSISFFGHYLYTFKSTRQWQSALWRFLTLSVLLLVCSSLVVKLCTLAGLTSSVSLIVAAISIPVLSYVLNKKLVF